MKKLIFSAISCLVLISCQDAKFTRSGDAKAPISDEPSKNPNSNPNDGSNGNTGNPNNPSNPSNPSDPTNNGKMINPNPSNPFWEPINPNPFFQSFGGDGIVWHIGDDGWIATSCKFKMNFRSVVQGRRFSFNFNIKEDNTTIKISMKYCGVDYQGSMAYVVGTGGASDVKNQKNLAITKDFGIFTPYATTKFDQLTLNRGWHKVQVISVQQGEDLDNYLVGRVNLDPNKAIELGQVTEE